MTLSIPKRLKKVLVTGINGMLGRNVYRKLIASTEFEVYGTGRSKSLFLGLKGYFQGDLCNEGFIKECSIIDYDFIIHCAALVDLEICEENYTLAEDTHVKASKSLALLNPKAIFIYISTDSVFDGIVGLKTELDVINPLNNYSLTKYLGGEAVRLNHDRVYDLRLNIYGFRTPLSNSIFEWAYREMSNKRQIMGFENVKFNPLYTGQISEVLFTFMKYQPDYGIYNLGSERCLSKYDFLEEIANVFNFDRSLVSKFKADFTKSNVNRPYNTSLNIDKLKNTFPNLDLNLEKGIQQLFLDFNSTLKFQ